MFLQTWLLEIGNLDKKDVESEVTSTSFRDVVTRDWNIKIMKVEFVRVAKNIKFDIIERDVWQSFRYGC